MKEVVQKIFLEHAGGAQIVHIRLGKMQVVQIFDHLLQAGADGVAVAVGIVAVEGVEDHRLIGILLLKIPLHHGELIKIGQQSKVSFVHNCSSCAFRGPRAPVYGICTPAEIY